MSDGTLAKEAVKLIETHLYVYELRRGRKATKAFVSLILMNLTAIGSMFVYFVVYLPEAVQQTASEQAASDAKKAAMDLVLKDSAAFREAWERASELILDSLKEQMAAVTEAYGDTEHQIGKVVGKLEAVSERMNELTTLASGLDGQDGRKLLKDIRSLAEAVKSPNGIKQLKQISSAISALEKIGVQGQSDVDLLRNGLAEEKQRVDVLQGHANELGDKLVEFEKQLTAHLDSKQTLCEVQFLSVDQDSRIRPPDGGSISDWNIIVLPLAPGRTPTLGSNSRHELANYKPGDDPTAVLNWFTCYAEPASEEEWRIVAQQRLYNPLTTRNKNYRLDVCVLMIAKESSVLSE